MGSVKPILGSHPLNSTLIKTHIFYQTFLHDLTQPAPSDSIVSVTTKHLFSFTYYAKKRRLLLYNSMWLIHY